MDRLTNSILSGAKWWNATIARYYSFAHVALVVENLRVRTKARPAKMKSLVNTINNLIGKDRPVKEAEAVRDELLARKYVVEDGLKVTYKLPKANNSNSH